ncbi:MAG: hypothetical protein US96_C0037G0003 [Candidatus Woesebacteria bacterium GW2011_GWB1_38_5b]|uniref:Uncharacterized protein n=1 Tax=Candidatus Woesebacteria bacterium GW2011_GWB1_38_5b TaxID=1618569 RepID=A0A0G0K3E8_9BACT|nr:MAG: hypothetical protein US96_C0037G0003 [Candidatus Woesebacteria bacterium GW2011_GWB1_38_5b]
MLNIIFNILMSAENNAGRPARFWLRQELIFPRGIPGKYELGRREHPGLSETTRLMAEYESDPEKIANEKRMIRAINEYHQKQREEYEAGQKSAEIIIFPSSDQSISNAAD